MTQITQNTQKMKKFNLFCGTDELRPVMEYVQFDGKYITATNTHILGRFWYNFGENVQPFYMHRNEWKKLFSVNPDHFTFSEGIVTGRNLRKGLVMLAQYLEPDQFSNKVGKYPDYFKVFPESMPEEINLPFIGLDPHLVGTVADALGEEAHFATFNFQAYNSSVIVTFEDVDGFALIAPRIVNKERKLHAYNIASARYVAENKVNQVA